MMNNTAALPSPLFCIDKNTLTHEPVTIDYHLLEAAVTQTSESILITDTKGIILYVNPAFERLTGYSKTEIIGQTPRLLKSGHHDRPFYQHLWGTLKAGRPWRGRFTNKKKDGTLYIAETTITPIRDKHSQMTHYVDVQRDITRELQLEEEEQQQHLAQKMEALGHLTSGIAHDFSNILTVISGFAELLHLRSGVKQEHQALLDQITNASQRGTHLIQQLLAFSRNSVIPPQIVDLKALTTEVCKMLQGIVSTQINLKTSFSEREYFIKAVPSQLEQIIINLIINACEAMPQGGQITVETTNIVLTDKILAEDLLTIKPGDYILLTVSDTGMGMSQAVKEHIFKPFFTTKQANGGTGLGLATVFSIVKQNEGYIQVESEENSGTTFKIYLPRIEPIPPVSPPLPSS